MEKQEFQEYGHLAKEVTHSHWLSMSAIKEAVDRLPAKEQTATKERLFRKTAKAVYGF